MTEEDIERRLERETRELHATIVDGDGVNVARVEFTFGFDQDDLTGTSTHCGHLIVKCDSGVDPWLRAHELATEWGTKRWPGGFFEIDDISAV